MRGSYGYARDNDNMGQDMLNMTGQFQRQWEQLDDFIDQEQVEASQNKLIQRMKERGGDLSGLSFDDVENIYDMQAIGLLQQRNSQNEQYRLQGMKNRDASDTEFYNQKIYPTMALIQQAYEKGDVQSFDALTQQLGNLMGTPYRYKLAADGQGFDEYFRSDAAMGFAPTGRKMSRDDVYKMVRQTADGTMFYMGGVGGQRIAFNPRYNLWAERQRQATARGNMESAMNPKQMIGPDGRLYYGAVQNKWADYNGDSDVLLFDQSGRRVGMKGLSELGREGFRWATGNELKSQGDAAQRVVVVDPKATPRTHQALVGAGYVWDKDHQGYYKATMSEEGTPVIDLRQPASAEFVQEMLRRSGEARQPAANPGGGSIAERTNNPLNLKRPGANTGTASDFQQFASIDDGFRGAWRQLRLYQNRYGLATPTQMIAKWAPASDGNNVWEYLATVQRVTGLDLNKPININDPQQAALLMKGMAVAESPLGQRVSPEQIYAMLAGGTGGAPGAQVAANDPFGLRAGGGVANMAPAAGGPALRGSHPPVAAGVTGGMNPFVGPPAPSANSGALVQLSAGQWGIIQDDGSVRPVSQEEARNYDPRPASPKRERKRRVTYHDVQHEMSETERQEWKKTGLRMRSRRSSG